MLIDTHCHLDAREFDDDRAAVVAAASAAGVAAIWVPAVEPANFAAVRACCQSYAACSPAYGIHPLFVQTAKEADLAVFRQWLVDERASQNPPLAVGEIGLDFYVPDYDAKQQEHFFAEQLKIARDMDLPVLLHVRRAIDPVLKHLRRIGVRGGVAHAFNGSRQQAETFIQLGFKLGFGGAMTYPGSTRIRELAATLPLEALVLETDAPDIPPRWRAAQRNSPVELPAIAQVLADLRGLSLEQIVEATGSNAMSILAGDKAASRPFPGRDFPLLRR